MDRQNLTRHWSMWDAPDRYSVANTHAMCAEGVAAVRAGRYDGLQFDLFNGDELRRVREYMAANAPEIPFGYSVTFGSPA